MAPSARQPERPLEPHTTDAPIFSAQDFADLKLEPKMVANLQQSLGISTMTSAQKLTIPHLLLSRDVLLKSPTGTGKTLAYAVPMIQHLQSSEPKVKREDGPLAVVVTPTRELALQTLEVLQKLLQPYVNIVSGLVIGGEKKKSEKARIRKGINIIVATPGRLVDHIRTTECLSLAKLQWLVFDEADRMTDKGFQEDVKALLAELAKTPSQRRTNVMLSATLTESVQSLAEMSLHNAVTVDTADDAGAGGDAEADLPLAVVPTTTSGRDEPGSTAQEDTKDSHAPQPQAGADVAQYSLPAKLKQFHCIVPAKVQRAIFSCRIGTGCLA